jgi:hypothetical protein
MTHEVRTLHGIVTGLTERPHAGSAPPKGSGGAPKPVRRPRTWG